MAQLTFYWTIPLSTIIFGSFNIKQIYIFLLDVLGGYWPTTTFLGGYGPISLFLGGVRTLWPLPARLREPHPSPPLRMFLTPSLRMQRSCNSSYTDFLFGNFYWSLSCLNIKYFRKKTRTCVRWVQLASCTHAHITIRYGDETISAVLR